jgi:predicted nuclease of predicted toxin-antitoxin system
MPLSLLFDEHASYDVMEGIIKRGVDALSVQQAGRRSAIDETILDLAARIERVVYTNDRDFLSINATGVPHSGIIYHRQIKYKVGQAVNELEIVCKVYEMEDMRNHVHYL